MAPKMNSTAKGCGLGAAILVAIPLLIVAVVGVKTWVPLQEAGESLDELNQLLGSEAEYHPAASGAIPPERLELFLELRETLMIACDHYGEVQKGFDAVESLETKDRSDAQEVGEVAVDLGGASLAITPFLARFFRLRNNALLEARMGLEEYAYIYALAFHEQLQEDATRAQIFSDGDAISAEASAMLRNCLERQLAAMPRLDAQDPWRRAIVDELIAMDADPNRLLWDDGLPAVTRTSLEPYREGLDGLFCRATAGLEMDQSSRRAIAVALE